MADPKAPANAEFVIIGEYWQMEEIEDSYEEGLVGESRIVLSESNFGTFPDLTSLIKSIGYGAPEDPSLWEVIEDGRIGTAWMVDENHVEATKGELELFAQGKKRLWSSQLDVYIKFARAWTPDDDTLNAMLQGKSNNPSPPKGQKLKTKLLR